MIKSGFWAERSALKTSALALPALGFAVALGVGLGALFGLPLTLESLYLAGFVVAGWLTYKLFFPIIRLALTHTQSGQQNALFYRCNCFEREMEQALSAEGFLICLQERLSDDFGAEGLIGLLPDRPSALLQMLGAQEGACPLPLACLEENHFIFEWARHNGLLIGEQSKHKKLQDFLNRYEANTAFGLSPAKNEQMVILARIDMSLFEKQNPAAFLRPLSQAMRAAFKRIFAAAKYLGIVEEGIVNRCGELAHEVSTPMLSLRLVADRLMRESQKLLENQSTTDAQRLSADIKTLSAIEKMAQKIDTTVRSSQVLLQTMLMNASNKNLAEADKESFDIKGLVQETLDNYPFKNQRQRDYITLKLEENFTISANRVLLGQVIINLVKNAIQAVDGQAEASIVLKTEFDNDNGCGTLEVRDSGSGIAEEDLPHLFYSSFTSKAAGKGFGFGLPFCRKVMQSIGGSIHCETAKEEFTAMMLKFSTLKEG